MYCFVLLNIMILFSMLPQKPSCVVEMIIDQCQLFNKDLK